MTQIPLTQCPPQYQSSSAQSSYNAVKIDIHQPQVNASNTQPGSVQTEPVTAPMYSYPQVPVYEMPQQSIYGQPPQPVAVNQPPAVQEMPTVPPPVIVPPTVNQTPAPAPGPEAKPQPVEVKEPEAVKPQVDLNEFISKLANSDFEVQAQAMEEIADMAQNSPQKATELLDVKVIDSLLGIMSTDSSKLAGPSAEQLQIREKIMSGKKVTEAETAEANKITPMEQAERNKQYAIYTVAILQKLYGSEIEKMNKTVVPLTELPGAAGIVEQVKNNPNPMVRIAGIDALSYIQRPEYKQDLSTIFSIAKNDKESHVQQAATKALEKLEQTNNSGSSSEKTEKTPEPKPVVTQEETPEKKAEEPKKTA